MASEFIMLKDEGVKATLNLIEKSILMSQYDKLVIGLSEEEFKDITIDEAIFTKSKLENQLWGKHASGVLKLANLLRHNRLCCVTSLVLASCDLETLPDMSTMRRTLRKLDVRGNRMSVLPDLRGLSGLEELSIQGNPIPMLPGWLADMPFILKMEAGSPQTVAISSRIIERIGYDKRYKVIISEQYKINLVSPPHFVLYQFKLSGGAKEITMKTAKDVMKMVKDEDIKLQEEVEEEPPNMVKEPREKIKFKSLEKPSVTEAPDAKKSKKKEENETKEKKDEKKESGCARKRDTKQKTADDQKKLEKDSDTDSEKSSSWEDKVSDLSECEESRSDLSTPDSEMDSKPKTEESKNTNKIDSKSQDDLFDDLDFDSIDQAELAELLEMDQDTSNNPGVKNKDKAAKKKRDKKKKDEQKCCLSNKSLEESMDVDDDINLDDLSADMQAELAEMLELDVDTEKVDKQERQRRNHLSSNVDEDSSSTSDDNTSVDSGGKVKKSSGSFSSSSSSDSTDDSAKKKPRTTKPHSQTKKRQTRKNKSSSSCSDSSDSDSESDSKKPQVEDADDIIARIKRKKTQYTETAKTRDTKSNKNNKVQKGPKTIQGNNVDGGNVTAKTKAENVVEDNTTKSGDEESSSSSDDGSSDSKESDSENDNQEEAIDAEDIIAKIKSQSAQRAMKKAEEEKAKLQELERNKSKNNVLEKTKTKANEQKGTKLIDKVDPANEARKKKLASLKENLASLKKEQEEMKGKRVENKADKAKQEDLRQSLETTRKELDALKISMETKKSQLDNAKELEKREEEARRIDHEKATKKAKEERLKEKQEKLKARTKKEETAKEERLKEKEEKFKARKKKEETAPESPGPPPPPPPVPKITVNTDDSASLERKLPFSAADLTKGKSGLRNPGSKARSVSPAVAKNMKKDLIGDLKDVLELRKKRGDGAGDRAMKPSMVKYSDRNLAGRSPSKSPLPRSKFPK